jgi:hypothetical protein
VVLLLDEAERRLSVEAKPSKASAEAMDHLRELIDLCGRDELPRTLILYAVTPAFTENVLPLYPALQQRLGQPIQFLSAHNPKAPVIDLEVLDLEPRRLLVEVGRRLLRVARRAYDWSPDESIALTNLERLAFLVTDEQLEAGHRRFFVKLWIRLLDQQRIGGERELEAGDLEGLVRGEEALVLEELAEEPKETFLGLPLRKKKT